MWRLNTLMPEARRVLDCADGELQIGDFPFCAHGSTLGRFAQGFSIPSSSTAMPPATSATRRTVVRPSLKATSASNCALSMKFASSRPKSTSASTPPPTSTSPPARSSSARSKPPTGASSGRRWMACRTTVATSPVKPSSAAITGGQQTREVGFHLDVFSNDSSNREVHRDERTQWKGRKG